MLITLLEGCLEPLMMLIILEGCWKQTTQKAKYSIKGILGPTQNANYSIGGMLGTTQNANYSTYPIDPSNRVISSLGGSDISPVK